MASHRGVGTHTGELCAQYLSKGTYGLRRGAHPDARVGRQGRHTSATRPRSTPRLFSSWAAPKREARVDPPVGRVVPVSRVSRVSRAVPRTPDRPKVPQTTSPSRARAAAFVGQPKKERGPMPGPAMDSDSEPTARVTAQSSPEAMGLVRSPRIRSLIVLSDSLGRSSNSIPIPGWLPSSPVLMRTTLPTV